METAKETGRPKRQDGPKKGPAKKTRDVKLTLRMTREERKKIRLYAVEFELEPNELILRWYRFRERLEAGPRLATATVLVGSTQLTAGGSTVTEGEALAG